MFVTCPKCGRYYDDVGRWTICPHRYLDQAPDDGVVCECGQRHHCFYCPSCGKARYHHSHVMNVSGEVARTVVQDEPNPFTRPRRRRRVQWFPFFCIALILLIVTGYLALYWVYGVARGK